MAGTRQVDPTITYFTFLDVETCFESNYPNYRKNYIGNCDTSGNRWRGRKGFAACYEFEKCWYIPDQLETSPLFGATAGKHNNKLVVFECRGNGQKLPFRNEFVTSEQLALVTMSSHSTQMQLSVDQGLPPPANKPAVLTAPEMHEIQTCASEAKRPYLLTFSGDYKRDDIRKELAKLDTTTKSQSSRGRTATTNSSHLVLVTDSAHLRQHTKYSYEQLMVQSKFVAAPRGDNPFSYRFTEALSAGAIPVLLSDEWVLPFRRELVHWDDCVITIPEKEVAYAATILAAMDDETRCQRRRYCYHIYQSYMQTAQGTIRGIVEGLQAISKM